MMHRSASHRAVHPESFPRDKATWRRGIRAARRALPQPERDALAAQLVPRVLQVLQQRGLDPVNEAGEARSIAAYFSSPDEPDTSTLLQTLVARGYRVYLPVCEPEYRLSWTRWEPGTALAPSPRAPVTEPVGPRHGTELFDQIELMFIPALAVDAAGMRLGQGGGYYDRFLPGLDGRGTRIAALVYDDEFVEAGSFEVDPHDRPVGLVITPSGHHDLDNGF